MQPPPLRLRRAYSGSVARREDSSIPTGRIRRTAQVGSVVGTQGARYAGTRAANLARSPEAGAEALEQRHLEAAERMVETLGRMKGAAMKIGQLASFIDTEFLPPEYRELYQEKLASLRSTAPPMPWKKVRARARRGVGRAGRGAVRGLRARGRGRRVDRPGPPRACCPTGGAWR